MPRHHRVPRDDGVGEADRGLEQTLDQHRQRQGHDEFDGDGLIGPGLARLAGEGGARGVFDGADGAFGGGFEAGGIGEGFGELTG